MMKKYHFLAFDIGATSGRAMVGTLEENHFSIQEVNRFPNTLIEIHGKLYWNIYRLYDSLKETLALCAGKGIHIDSIGIDTWGVDFGYIGKDGSLLGLPRAYRDPYTKGTPDEFFKCISRREVYDYTGIQIMEFNSLFQLFRAKKEKCSYLEHADQILFIPDLLSYLLTGRRICEYTDASTSQLLNARSKQFETALFDVAGLPSDIVGPVVMPGTIIDSLTDELARSTGIGKIPVVAVAGHDTASAVVAVPASDSRFAYLSSGTWSLMGIETDQPVINDVSYKHNFTNEGGIEGTIRFLKNITGMWLLEQCRKEWNKEGCFYSYQQIMEMAKHKTSFYSLVDPDNPCFTNPVSMTAAIKTYCDETGQIPPRENAEFVRCIFISLVDRYRQVLELLSEMTSFDIDKLHVIGGGAKNYFLNQLTANAIKRPVIAGPYEATAVGNCMVQAKALGVVADRWEMRRIIASSLPVEIFYPENN